MRVNPSLLLKCIVVVAVLIFQSTVAEDHSISVLDELLSSLNGEFFFFALFCSILLSQVISFAFNLQIST